MATENQQAIINDVISMMAVSANNVFGMKKILSGNTWGLFMAWFRAVGSLYFWWKIARKSDILSQVKKSCKMVEGMILSNGFYTDKFISTETLRFYEKAGYNSSDKTAFIQWIGMDK